ncbi:hypothetical protein [Actinokineospora iranica]|uniref:hypothetical protein n=1 Tax=Actinokineospora iranica TaxID=1271860 RepID=UPI000B8322A7|nr:hypothetical protein [Actinokineospora iranica]
MTGACYGSLAAAALAGALLFLSDRPLGYLGFGAGLSAVVALVLALPLRAGQAWARYAFLVTAPVGALCAPAAANALCHGAAAYVGALLITLWVAVVVLLLRVDVREHFADPGRPGAATAPRATEP